jgi:spore germination protein YaaH
MADYLKTAHAALALSVAPKTAATIRHSERKTRGNGQIVQIVRRDAEVA